ncbi:MAG: hypothetical protein ACE14S_12440 [Candidatus Bathyarchaeia archaeon]
MNWKTVLYLIRVDMKSGRLLRGQKLTKYNAARGRYFSYSLYGGATVIGIIIGVLVGYAYNSFAGDPATQALFPQYFPSFLLSLPTIVLVYTLVFTMLQQIQRSGVQSGRQVPYWLPVTWQEHTLASILAELLGFPLISIALIGSSAVVFSLYIGQTATAVGAVLAMVAAAFMASATTEVFRILQVRFIGAVYKSSGRAAIWVRFIGSLIFFVVFYIIYFSITAGANSLGFIQAVASGQSLLWFVPFVWLGMTLYSFMTGLMLEGAGYLVASALFIVGLFLVSVELNKRFGLYEPPAITVSRGAYVPKTGLLGKLGFSSLEAALIRKDLRAFTRRRELMSTFIIPVVFIILPIMMTLNGAQSSGPPGFSLFWFVYMTLFPTGIMAMSLGSFMTGEEGQSIWRIYMSPISPSSFVKSKFAFVLFFSLIILPVTATAAFFAYQPSFRALFIMVTESVFLAFCGGALSLANGIKGADFNEVPRPRMVRPEWAIMGFLMAAGVSLAVLAPFFPYVIPVFTAGAISSFIDLYAATAISGVIAAVLTVVFYKMAVGNARELMQKAEV